MSLETDRTLLDLCVSFKHQSPNLMNFNFGLNPLKNDFQLSAGLNLEELDAILSGTNHFEPRLKFFKFGLRVISLKYERLRVSRWSCKDIRSLM